ncbi:MAG TPA: DUF559 domain-containing protein [Solirubrobacterales bacterium]
MAAVLSCGLTAVLSQGSAAALWGIEDSSDGRTHISVRSSPDLRRPGVQIHRRSTLRSTDVTVCDGIPVTTPVRTLVDLAIRRSSRRLERAINEADKRDLISPDALRAGLDGFRGQPGVRRLRTVLDRRTFRMTDSELERRFLPLVDQAGLPRPLTQQRLNGFKVDFFWPGLGLVIETDGLRYHRTPAEQARDRLRDQTHTAAGLTQLRFTHAQVRYEAAHVRRTLAAIAHRLDRAPDA